MINSLNSLNELSDIYMGSISEEDNSPEAVKARVMQHVRAIRYRARKEGETLNKAYNEFMGSQSGISSTEKQMVKERLGLTGGSAHVGEETSLKDLRRASNLSTSDDPRDQDAAREIKTQMDYEDLLKQRGKKVKKESRVSWRDELREIASDIPVKEKQAEKKVVEKKINNKIEINPTQTQAESFAKELGGELLEMYEVKEEENVDAGEVEDPKARAQEGREKRMKLRLLRLKMQSARQGVPGIVAHYEPEGDVISEKQKDTPDQVKAVIAYDKARKATDDAVYDTEHGKKKQAKKEKDYAKWQRDQGAEDAQKSGHPWEHAKGSTREKEGKKSEKHAHIKDDYTPLTDKVKAGLSNAYLAVYGEDAKYGYDKKGNSLNPVDIEKKKRKDDDLFGSPKKKGVKEGVAKKEIGDLQKAGKTLKGKWVAMADQLQDEKNWIQKAVKRPGAFTAKANKHDMSVQGFAKYVDDNPKKFDTRTKRQANLAQTFASMKKEDMDEMIEILGEVLLEG